MRGTIVRTERGARAAKLRASRPEVISLIFKGYRPHSTERGTQMPRAHRSASTDVPDDNPTDAALSDMAYTCEQRAGNVLVIIRRLAETRGKADEDNRVFEVLAELLEPVASDLSLLHDYLHTKATMGEDRT